MAGIGEGGAEASSADVHSDHASPTSSPSIETSTIEIIDRDEEESSYDSAVGPPDAGLVEAVPGPTIIEETPTDASSTTSDVPSATDEAITLEVAEQEQSVNWAIEDTPEGAATAKNDPALSRAKTGERALDLQGDTVADTELVRPAGVEDSSLGALEQEVSTDTSDASAPECGSPRRNGLRHEPLRYAGLAGHPPRRMHNSRERPRATVADSARRERTFPIEVRLRFARGGSCFISLVASRSSDLPEDLVVATSSEPLDLCAMQEEWYQDVVPDDLARILREGTTWWQEDGTIKWSLSGRELYVLGDRPDLSGWVSQPRLKLGRKHAVLCTDQIRRAVEEALLAAGVGLAPALDPSFGAPAGWVVIPDVVPSQPATPSLEADILNALRPLPEVEISLEGGIRLEYATWLQEYPPLIRVYGDAVDSGEVQIDGVTTLRGDEGAYRVRDWDAVGTHTVWCQGTSKSYSIARFDTSWDAWDAYTFPLAVGASRRISICGPLVREASTDENDEAASIQVPQTHAAILGARPGEYARGVPVSGTRGAPCLAFPRFEPVWALPADPLRCDKENSRVILFSGKLKPPAATTAELIKRGPELDAWCRLILDASRKGLAAEPSTDNTRALWRKYKQAARRIWRSRK